VTGTGPTVKRTVFSTPRSAEFLELQALQSQTGQYAEDFGHVVVKELLDNALDAAETASRTPVVDIATRTDKYNEITFVTVSDNGAGITPATVAGLCDFTMLVSDKARYRAQRAARRVACHELRDSQPARRCRRHQRQGRQRPRGGHLGDRALPSNLDIDAQRWAYGAAP
jgi:hypothetical protein